MKIFITGGTGFIGRHLVEALDREGHFLFVLTRNAQKAKSIFPKDISFFEGTIEKPESYRGVFENSIDAVFHLAAIPGEKWGVSQSDYEKTNINATKTLLRKCEKKIRLFVFCSSINAIKNQAGFCEKYYGKSKREAEKIVSEKKSFKTVIIRPAIVYGPGDENGMISRLCQMIQKRKFILIGRGKNILPVVYIDDLIRAFMASIELEKTGKTMEISGPEFLTAKKICQIIAEKTEANFPPFFIPVRLARLIALFSEKFFPLIGKEPLITRSRVDIITKSNPIGFEKAKNLINYQPKVGFSQGMEKTIDWMKQNGYLS